MLLVIKQKATEETLKKVAEDLDGYIKVVVDIHRRILSAGGKLHVDGEKILLADGSRQADVWGGGLDLETGSVDFDSMINLRPSQDNRSREVLSQDVRRQMETIIRGLLK